MQTKHKPPLDVRLMVLGAVYAAQGNTIRARIKQVAKQTFVDPTLGHHYRFTWRTISTWFYRYHKHGITAMENKTRSDKNQYRKVQLNELAEAINEILPHISTNKSGLLVKSVVYRRLIEKACFQRSQLSPTAFYRMVRNHNLLDIQVTEKLRQSFAMQFANELWQADTMHGPAIKQADGKWRKTFLIAFIDDASRVIVHAQFFYSDNTENIIEAFRSALFKRGKPERLYFDNGSNYRAKEILQACLRLDINLIHTPVRDGAAKGKIERFFRSFRDRFLTQHITFDSLESLNRLTRQWIEDDYNNHRHSSIGMTPVERFQLDLNRIHFLADDQFTEEVFYHQVQRKVSKTNVFSLNNQQFECPVDLRGQTIHVRYNRTRQDRFIVYFDDQRTGEANPLQLHYNALVPRASSEQSS